jgi:LacI family transcriptional regulator
MKHIAEAAGVSVATVSMCLNNNPEISTATRRRVQALARELGYRPNPLISALMRSRRQRRLTPNRPTIALVCAEATRDGWRKSASATIRQMHAGAVERAKTRGYQLEEFWLHQDGMSAERFSEMLYTRDIQGLLLSPLPDNTAPPKLHWEYFSAVGIGVPFKSLALPTVCNDHYFSSFLSVHECHRLGYRRPGLVLRKSHQDRFHGRWDGGFRAAQQSLPDLQPVRTLTIDDWSCRDDFARWLDDEKPDAVVTLGSEVVGKLLQDLGHRVPEDIGLAGLSCPRLGDHTSGIFQNGRLTGATAMDLLISMLERHEKGLPEQAVTVMIEGLWNAGHTLRGNRIVTPSDLP